MIGTTGLRRVRRLGTATVLMAGSVVLFGQSGSAAATLNVCPSGCTYTTIGAAVTAASAGDVIDVGAGTYNENGIVISKPLTINGAGTGQTIVDGGGGTTSSGFIFSITPLGTGSAGAIELANMTLQNTPIKSSTNGYAVFTKVNSATTPITAITFDSLQITGRGAGPRDNGLEIASGVTSGARRQAPPVLVTHTTVQNTGANGILVDDWGGPVTVRNSNLYASPGVTRSALFFFSETGNSPRNTFPMLVQNNTFHGSAVGAQTLQAGDGGFDSLTVENNVMTDMAGADSGVLLLALPAPLNAFGTVTVTGNAMTGDGDLSAATNGVKVSGPANSVDVENNDISGLAHGITVVPAGGVGATSVTAHLNRFFGDVSGLDNSSAATVDATANWWGCNEGPTVPSTTCSPVTNTGSGSVDTSTWIVASASAAHATLVLGDSTHVKADLTHLNDGSAVTLPAVFTGLPVGYSADHGAMSVASATLSGGSATSVYTAPGSVVHPATVTVVVDRQAFSARTVTGPALPVPIDVIDPVTPTVTATATVTTTAPAPTVTETVTQTATQTVTQTVTATATVSTTATVTATVTASNGVASASTSHGIAGVSTTRGPGGSAGGTGSSAGLAETGASVHQPLILGGLLLVAGTGLMVLAGRRRRGKHGC